MAWKVIGLIDGRNGHISVLPEWAIGTPNDFAGFNEAASVAEAMRVATAKQKPTINYMAIPTIDASIIAQVRGSDAPAPKPQPLAPALSFENASRIV
jgi:hypothetical protein